MSQSHDHLQRTFTDSIAENYDGLLGPVWFGPIAQDLARRLPSDPGGDVLEVACGTGLMTHPLRVRLDSRRRLIATDLSDSMLRYASAKLSDVGEIEWRNADALHLPFADGAFAALACSLGVMFVPDRKALFLEIRRVLRPGGLLLFNVWDRVEENPCVRVYSEVVESMFPGDAQMQFSMPYSMHDTGMLRQLVVEAGFSEPKIEKVVIPIQGVTARRIATGQVRGSPRGLLLSNRGVDLDAAIDQVTAALEQEGGVGTAFRAKCQVIVVETSAA